MSRFNNVGEARYFFNEEKYLENHIYNLISREHWAYGLDGVEVFFPYPDYPDDGRCGPFSISLNWCDKVYE